MNPRPWQLRDPARLLTAIADRVPLVEGTALLALVHHPSTEQNLVGAERLDTPAVIDDYEAASEEICLVMQRFAVPDHRRRPEHSGVTVVVRDGLCVLGPNEGQWHRAWRYSNHLQNVFDGGLILVTRYGWVDVLSDTAGHSPAMAA